MGRKAQVKHLEQKYNVVALCLRHPRVAFPCWVPPSISENGDLVEVSGSSASHRWAPPEAAGGGGPGQLRGLPLPPSLPWGRQACSPPHPRPSTHLFVFLGLARGQGLHRRAPIIMAGTEGVGGLKTTAVLPGRLRIQPEYFPRSTWWEVPREGSQGPTAVLGSGPKALHLLLRSRAPWRPVLGQRQRAEVSLPVVSVSLKPERLEPRRRRDHSTLPNPVGPGD